MPRIDELFRADIIPPSEFSELAYDMRDLIDKDLNQLPGHSALFALPYPEIVASSFVAEITASMGTHTATCRYAQLDSEGNPRGFSLTGLEVTRNAIVKVLRQYREQRDIDQQFLITLNQQDWQVTTC